MANNKLWWWGIILIIILGFLFYYPRLGKKSENNKHGLSCMNANLPVIYHIHPIIKIFVSDNPLDEARGKQENIPANLGLTAACHLPVHTHDTSGTIHVESHETRDYKLSEFFGVWGKTINRDGYSLEVTIDGKQPDAVNVVDDIALKDKQEIILKYKKK